MCGGKLSTAQSMDCRIKNPNAKRTHGIKMELQDPTNRELQSFHELQKLLSRPTTLSHHDPEKQLYIYLDASKAFGFSAMVYHSKKITTDAPYKTDVQPILFLSCLLTPAETRYWPTELEITRLVWTVRKTRHLIEAATNPTIVFTDHAAALSIVRQTSLSTVATNKLNLRLTRASEYLQQFKLDVRYKPGKSHPVPDALSRLAREPASTTSHDGILNTLDKKAAEAYVLTATVVNIVPEFKEQIKKAYQQNPTWSQILKQCKSNAALREDQHVYLI